MPANAWAATVTMGATPAEDSDAVMDEAALDTEAATLDAEAFAEEATLLADLLSDAAELKMVAVLTAVAMVLPPEVMVENLVEVGMGEPLPAVGEAAEALAVD